VNNFTSHLHLARTPGADIAVRDARGGGSVRI
jgi:hypothetical protein